MSSNKVQKGSLMVLDHTYSGPGFHDQEALGFALTERFGRSPWVVEEIDDRLVPGKKMLTFGRGINAVRLFQERFRSVGEMVKEKNRNLLRKRLQKHEEE